MERGYIEKEITKRANMLSRLKKLIKLYGRVEGSLFRKKEIWLEMKKLSSVFNEDVFVRWLEEEERRIKAEEDIFKSEFGKNLSNALSKKGFEIKGQFPLLRFGFYTLKVSFEKPHAELYWGPQAEYITGKIPLSVDEILKEVVRVHSGITARNFDVEKFDELLLNGYRRLLTVGDHRERRVKIPALLKEVIFLIQSPAFFDNPSKRNFKEYPRYYFSYDLYRIRSEGKRWRFIVAPFDATTRKRDALWIPDDTTGSGTYYAYMERIE